MINSVKYILIFFAMLLLTDIGDMDAQSINNNRTTRLVDPNFFHVCYRSSPYIETCIKDTLSYLILKLRDGIPDLQIGVCEPLPIGDLAITKTDTGLYAIQLLLKDVKLHGFTALEVDAVEVNSELTELKIMIHADQIKMTANYEFSGHLFGEPVSGANIFIGRSTNLDALVTIRGEKITKPFWNNVDYFQIQNVEFEVIVENAKIKFNALHCDAYDANKLLNGHWYLVSSEIDQHFQNEMAKMVEIIASRFFDKYSFDELFPV